MPRPACYSLLLIVILAFAEAAFASEPLHVRIDQLIAAKANGPLAERTTDAEFLRRIYLDLAGRIPSAAEARAFLADASSDKRVRLVDSLLNGPGYPTRMQELFHVMLMERLGDHDDWTRFLHTSFAENKPWDRMVREMLSPNAEDEAVRGAALFLTKRLENYGQNPVDYPALTRDLGRLFLGVDLQCAQCHDHLFIEDYKQHDFQGLFAFVGQTFIRRDVQFPAVGENPVNKKVEFMSVFVKEPKQTGPRLPGGGEVEVPELKKGEEFIKPPDKAKKFPGELKFSPLKILSEQLPRADNTAFVRNIANRLWYVMHGRGLVYPLDLHHSDNPPSHPELLDLLANELAAHELDMKWLLRELALSETYQRSTLLPEGVERLPADTYQVALEKPLSAEQLLRSTLQATGEWDQNASHPKLDEYRKKFLAAFANPAREPEVEFMPSVKAALFLSNDATVLSWLKPRSGNLIEMVSKLESAEQIAEELYLSLLSRFPTEEEIAEVAELLSKQPERKADLLGHVAWALLASTEFCVNH